MQMQSAERDGKPFAPRMLRRLVGLWVLGLLHAVVLYHGDILTTYAVIGGVLLLLRRRGDGVMTFCAVSLVLLTSLLWASLGFLMTRAGVDTDTRSLYAEAVAALQAPTALAMFLAGFIAGRRGLLANAGAHRALFERLFFCGLLIGVPGAMFYGLSTMRNTDTGGREVVGLALGLLTAPFLTAAYASGLVLLFQAPRGQALVAWLAPAGRMALSNYLLQSLVCAWIFLAYGLRLMGSVGPLASFAFAFSIFAVQLLLSRWWMQRFAYGPVEWLLRAFTLLELPSMRKSQRMNSVES
jgi:uncharacterized protein